MSAGHFEAFVNRHAARPTPGDKELMASISKVAREVASMTQVRWAGSQRKGTAIVGSDLDVIVESREPIMESQRRDLRAALEKSLHRPAIVLSHAVRLPANGGRPKVDIAFANAAFGSRALPDLDAFHDQPCRQTAARALKLWVRGSPLPRVPGWVAEAVVVHRDAPAGEYGSLALFLRVIDWLGRSSASAFESVLRPAASPRWNEAWSASLPGRVEAISNYARALSQKRPGPEEWRSADDVGRWLGR